MSSPAARALAALLLVGCALVGCQRNEPVAPASADGSGVAVEEPLGESGDGEAAEPTSATPSEAGPSAALEEEKPPEVVVSPRQPLVEAQGELDAAEWVAHGIYRARTVALNHAMHRFGGDAHALPGSDAAVANANVRLLFASNVAGELSDCGCRRNPLGGLARRAQLARDWADDGLPLFHLDAGNALTRSPLFSNDAQRQQATTGADAMLRGFAAMGLEAMAVGWNDVSLGADWLVEHAQSAGLTLLSANWTHRGQPLGETRLVMEREGKRIGVTAVGGTTEPAAGFFASQMVETSDMMAAADEIRALRADDVDLVVLIVTAGVDDASTLLPRLASANALPDLVLASGSRRTMREAAWVEGIPIVESSDRGRNLVALDLGLDDTSTMFRRQGDDISGRLRQARTTLQASEGTANRLRSARADGAPEQRIRTFELLLRRQHRQLREQMRALSVADVASGDEGWTLAVHLRPVPLDTPEDAAVKGIVDEAIADGWEPPHQH